MTTTRPQPTVASTGFGKHIKTTRRAQFLAEMERLVPWREQCARVEPVHPKAGDGRPRVSVERMLRMYYLHHSFNLSDSAIQEALYETPAMRAFVAIDLGQESVDETTMRKVRDLMEKRGLSRALFEDAGRHLRPLRLTVSTGTIGVGAFITALASTKNAISRCMRPQKW